MERDSFVFYRSFYEAIRRQPKKVQADIYNTIADYALNGTEPTQASDAVLSIFLLIKPQIDANNHRYTAGKKGGRPSKTDSNKKEEKTKTVDSEKEGKTVGVVDERSEIAACYLGVPQNDLGVTTDVLDGCPKAEGMLMLLRSMAPDVIAVDEIGTKEDMQAICQVANCGCKILATIHGTSIEEIRDKPFLKEIIGLNIFQRFLVLDNRFHVGSIKGVYKERGTVRV